MESGLCGKQILWNDTHLELGKETFRWKYKCTPKRSIDMVTMVLSAFPFQNDNQLLPKASKK